VAFSIKDVRFEILKHLIGFTKGSIKRHRTQTVQTGSAQAEIGIIAVL
jgi:hypothetical protein